MNSYTFFSNFEKQETLEVKKRTALWKTVKLCSSNIVSSLHVVYVCVCLRVCLNETRETLLRSKEYRCRIGCCWKFIFRRAGPCASECAGMSCVSKRPVVSLATPCGWGLVCFGTQVWHRHRNEGQASTIRRRLV